ncbi:MAG: valine--tRNA ligase [Planctomycetes bacterium]|nr:valine--tRNA ligase [Planctomycetota bacterium]
MTMAKELAKVYDPRQTEADIYALWRQARSFAADPKAGGPTYTIVIPPPNVTAALHLGHALNNTLQDILVRWKRMAGFNTLWMPGTDHAGIATQTVVEKRILAEEGRRRGDFTREAFIGRIQAWKDEYEARILGQLEAMGCSCDWDRTRFTMDEVCAAAVRTAFFQLFADGLIYRGKRLVNWDPATQTVLADDEVEHETVKGFFWYLRYPLVEPVMIGGAPVDHVTVATTRPETMLGDTAVAINPRDPRAAALVGREVRLPLVGRIIPIIADEYVVLGDPDSDDPKARFATGFLKVTPAHDPNDWAIGQRHDLPIVNVMAPDGTISDRYGWDDAVGSDAERFLGMDRFEAREAIVEWFRAEGLLEDIRDYDHEVGHSYRSHVPIEPYLSDQWYIAVKQPIGRLAAAFGDGILDGTDVPANSLAGIALKPLLAGRLKFTPERYAVNYRTWLENLRDWPISRQLWWGHRIPVWSKDLPVGGEAACPVEGAATMLMDHPDDPSLRRLYVCPPTGTGDVAARLEAAGFQQDPDVLDTWFSSGLWPISTMGWPNETDLLKRFYPTDVLCTAREIITLWVSRMVMFGQYFRQAPPFHDVYIHAMIQDGEGRKMSKSLGNGIDPLDIIDSHGADALRYTLASMTTETQDVRMPVEHVRLPDGRERNTSPKFDLGRNFSNKLWNASRFALMNVAGAPSWQAVHPGGNLADTWILSRLHATIRDATSALETYRFNELAGVLYRFTWDDFCDWYLEIAKRRIAAGEAAPKAIVAYVLDGLLRLLHPVIPYITEAVWQQLNEVVPLRGLADRPGEPLLVRAAWPRAQAELIQGDAERQFDAMRELIRGIRQVRTTHNVPPSRELDVTIDAAGGDAQRISDNLELIRSQANLGELTVRAGAAKPDARAATVVAAGVTAFVADVVDVEAERARLEKERATVARGIASAEGKLSNAKFVANAPPAVVEAERKRLAEMQGRLDAIDGALAAL